MTVGVLNKELDAHRHAPNLYQQLLFLDDVRILHTYHPVPVETHGILDREA